MRTLKQFMFKPGINWEMKIHFDPCPGRVITKTNLSLTQRNISEDSRNQP